MFSSREVKYAEVLTNAAPSSAGLCRRGNRNFFFLCCVVAGTALLLVIGTRHNNVVDESTPVLPSSFASSDGGDPNPEAPWPRIAWLMSFPNSGTSFTMRLIQRASNMTAATNYGKESAEVRGLAPDGTNIPLYSNSPGGPFLLNSNVRYIPERYVLTKTHCGGRCNSCGPKNYILNQDEFLDWCLRGGKYIRTESGDGTEFIEVHYNASLVQRAIHLIRDPFDNVVSNFHLEQHEKTKKKDESWLKKYPNNPEGFQSWCSMIDSRFIDEEKKSDSISEETIEMFERVPCHGDFYRYAQWHNLALKVIRKMKLPTLVMHYENFEKKYEKWAEDLLGFLQLPRNGELPEFIAGKSYKTEFFTGEQLNATMALIRSLSSDESWALLKRYEEMLHVL